MNLQQFAAGKTKAELTTMADNLETIIDGMVPAKGGAAKTLAAKATTTKTIAAKTAGGGFATKATGVSAKSGSIPSLLACCSKGFAGLGALGPLLLVAGGAAAGWYVYKKHFRTDPDLDIDAPSF
jgi:hypothetical protein